MVFVCVSIMSCSSDDDDSDKGNGGVNVTSEQLMGKWINTKKVVYDSRDPQPDEETYSGKSRYLQLNDDGTGMITPYNLFEAEIKGTFTWKLSGSVLSIMESNGDVEKFTVTGISSTNLELTWYDNDEGISIREVSSFTRATE